MRASPVRTNAVRLSTRAVALVVAGFLVFGLLVTASVSSALARDARTVASAVVDAGDPAVAGVVRGARWRAVRASGARWKAVRSSGARWR